MLGTTWLSGNTGVIIPKGTEFQRRVRIALRKIVADLGTDQLMKVYKEKGVYNTYVWIDGAVDDASGAGFDINAGETVTVGTSGNSRRVQP